MFEEDSDDNFSHLGETLAAVAALRTDAKLIAETQRGQAQRPFNLHRNVQLLFETGGIWARLRSLYGVAYKNRKVWGAFPRELIDLRRFIVAPFAPGLETSIETLERILLEKMTMAARQDADERLYGRSQATHAGWADIWSLDVHTAKQWRTDKDSQFRNLVARMLRAERRQQTQRRVRAAKQARRLV